ncbi:MAG: hypothetical protein WAL29_05015 [Bacteroidales bacterium]
MKKALTLLILFIFTGLLINSQPTGKSLPQLGGKIQNLIFITFDILTFTDDFPLLVKFYTL